MTILLLKGYNNYFNRIHKQEADITAYKTASTSYLEYPSVNFDPQDGIATTLIVGGETQVDNNSVTDPKQVLKFDELGCPDYLICHEQNVLKSRWFIIESVKVRQGQYKLALKRDLLADFNSQIMNSPCFVEKGTLTDVNDPLLLNSEGMKFNEIKQGESVLRDSSNCAWLVGYLKKNMSDTHSVNYTFPSALEDAVSLDSFDWSDCVDFQYEDGTFESALKKATKLSEGTSYVRFRTYYRGWDAFWGGIDKNIRTTISLDGNLVSNDYFANHSDWQGLTSTALDAEHHGSGVRELEKPQAKKLSTEIFDHTMNWSYVNGFFNTMVSNAKYDISQGNNLTIITEDISKYNGRRVIKDNKVFRLQIGQGTPITFDKYYTGEASVANDYLNSLYYEFRTNWFLQRNTDNPGKKKIKITLAYQQYTITAIEEPDASTLSYTLPVSANRATCSDAMYDMFCMPVSPKVFGLESEDTNVVIVYEEDLYSTQEYIFLDTETTSAGHLALAELLATELGAGTAAGEIYDLQLLPFCPITELDPYFENHAYGPTYGKIVFDLNTIPSNMYTIIKNNSNQACGVVFYPNKANFSTWVDFSSPGETVHEEWLKIEKPVLTAQGRQGDLTRWAFFSFPYKVTDGTWDIGPNLNNSNVDVELSDGLTNEDCEYINLYVSSGLEAPFLSIASEDLPLQPANDYSTTITGDFTIRVLAHWIMPDSALDKKIKNECDFYRLTSPNYNSFYEFKKTKLYGGNIEKLITVCTYKPISPYIKINPDLNGSLYSDKWYNDNIGLMLAGDYSIPMMSDAMINYELQNRNYQAIFNRQIQNLDVNQQIAKEQQQFQGIVGAITAPLTGGLAGAATGAKAGPYGAIAGAVVGVGAGAALGGVGYAKDMEWLQQQQAEARDFAIDQFNYQLGNIQALPQSMTKSTPLSFHNKVWPIIEYFSCTDREKDVLRNKLKYDGMTIMAIGSLNDYSDVGGYLKGKMIRLNNLGDDSHVANAIYEEVNKGFYEGE